jgi:uncharacterized protein YraI
VVGTIAADNTPVTYSFNGNVGDVVTIRAVGMTLGTNPNLMLLGPAQQPLAFNENEAFAPLSTAAAIVFRLQGTGTHVVRVSGTQGDFVLSLAVRPPIRATNLELDTPAQVALPVAEPAQGFVFNTDPSRVTSLLIDITPADADAQIAVRNATGEAVAVLRNNLVNVCISFGPGDELHEVTVASLPVTTGTVTITLSNASCELGDVPAQVTPVPGIQFTPVPIEGACAASSPRNVNIRSGPSTNFGVVALLPASQPIQVVGQNEDGSWFAVQNEFVQGWIAASVVVLVGPCDNLPVTPIDATPAASPTPGLPAFTPTPESTAEVTPTVEVTEEPTPEVTPTVEVTEEPTAEVTPP